MTKKIKGTALILDLCCHVGNLEHLIQVRATWRHCCRFNSLFECRRLFFCAFFCVVHARSAITNPLNYDQNNRRVNAAKTLPERDR